MVKINTIIGEVFQVTLSLSTILTLEEKDVGKYPLLKEKLLEKLKTLENK